MDPGSVAQDLERAALHALLSEWRMANVDHFEGRLQRPLLELVAREKTLGRWIASRRIIELDRKLVFSARWSIVREVLKHEMAHQYVDEVLGLRGETAHGPAFKRVCEARGIDASAAGLPSASAEDAKEHKIIERVAKLLALATSANEHEAHTAMNAAQRLMLEHNLASIHERRARRFVSREIGEPTGRIEEARSRIGSLLGEHFFVEIIVANSWKAQEARWLKVFEITGTPENVAMAEYVYAFLDRTADALWSAHKSSAGIRGDRDRRAFRAGVIMGFSDKLSKERADNTERGLVWIGDPELEAHYRLRHPRVERRSGGSYYNSSARESGIAAGRELVLTKPVTTGASSSRGLALGDGRTS